MKQTVLLTLLVMSLAACTFYPKSMQLQTDNYEVTDFEDISFFIVDSDGSGPVSVLAPTVKLKLSGKAYNYIYSQNYFDQFRCYVMSGRDRLSDTEFGNLYYKDAENNLREIPSHYESKPKISVFYGYIYHSLAAPSEVNGPPDINLLTHNYSHIKCNLIGVASMLGPLYSSNDIVITKEQILTQYEKFRAR